MMIDRRTFTLAGVSLLALSPAARAQAKPTLRIGYQLPLTGNTAQYGQDFKTAAEIALAAFNGDASKPFKVEIDFQDSRSDAKEGVTIARKFADDKTILAVLGDFTSGVSMAAAQVYAQVGVAQLSQTASHPDYTKISKWQFRNITNQSQEGPYNADWIKSRGFSKIAVTVEQTDWGQTVVSNFVDKVKSNGGEVVFNEYFNRGLADFRPIITKIQRAKPDAIYAGVFYEDGAQLLKQMKQLGVTIPVFSTSAAYSPQLLQLAGPDAEGLSLTSTFLPSFPAKNVQDFVAAWKAKSNGAEPGQFPAQAYDAVGIMLVALEKSFPNPTRDKVRDALAATKDYPGVTGVTSFDANREPAKALVKVTVKDGKFVSVPS